MGEGEGEEEGEGGLGLARSQSRTCTVVFYEELGEDNALHVFLVH